jgi:hypothetical protein
MVQKGMSAFTGLTLLRPGLSYLLLIILNLKIRTLEEVPTGQVRQIS